MTTEKRRSRMMIVDTQIHIWDVAASIDGSASSLSVAGAVPPSGDPDHGRMRRSEER
jgi:predicted TIM-barrel fold metal-dependent hydrolase